MHTLRASLFVERILANFVALARTSELLFLLIFAAASVASTAIASYSMELLHIDQPERAELLKFGLGRFFMVAVVVAPIIETFVFQQLPIVMARRFRTSVGIQLAAGSIPFAMLHFESGLVTGVAAGIVGGVFLSFAYLTFIPQSKLKAFCMTAAIHALHNLVPVVLYARDLP